MQKKALADMEEAEAASEKANNKASEGSNTKYQSIVLNSITSLSAAEKEI